MTPSGQDGVSFGGKASRRSALFGVLLALGASCATPPAEREAISTLVHPDGWTISVGDRIPPLEFVDETGQRRALDEFLGQPVVLLFWGST